MRGLTLHQPWASLVATGAKRIETRSWRCGWPGLLAIHAAKTPPLDIDHYLSLWPFQGGLAPLVGRSLDLSGQTWAGVTREHLPFGAIVAIATLLGCVPTDSLTLGRIATDQPFGDYSLGRFAWLLDDIRALPEPIPCRGMQGLWPVPDDVMARLAEMGVAG